MSATADQTDTTHTFGVITPGELDRPSEVTNRDSFQQWFGQVRLAKIRGHEVECVGVCDTSGNLVTGCVILYLNGCSGADSSVYFGPIGISDDPALLRAIIKTIHESVHRHHAVSVVCWPSVVYRLYSSNGQPNGELNDALLAGFADAGWTHGGFHTGYGVVCQWMYVRNLTGIANGEELLASFGKRAQWSAKQAQSMGVHVREIGPDEFDVFVDIEQRIGEHRGFATRSAGYFHQFRQACDADAHFILAEIRIAEYMADMTIKREVLQTRIAQLQAEYDEHLAACIEHQLEEESRNLTTTDRHLTEVEGYARRDDVLPVAASMFTSHPDEMVYQYSGSLKEYKPFYASALIQYEAVLYLCVERDVPRYNFYDISGVFDGPNDEGRGVPELKQDFNGCAKQMVNKFTLSVDGFHLDVDDLTHKLLCWQQLAVGG